MKVRFFAQSREAAGRANHVLDVKNPITQAEFWTLLVKDLPALASHQKTARLARGETYLTLDETLQPEDEIAVIPPVSGG